MSNAKRTCPHCGGIAYKGFSRCMDPVDGFILMDNGAIDEYKNLYYDLYGCLMCKRGFEVLHNYGKITIRTEGLSLGIN